MSSGKATLDTLIRADPSLTVVGTWLSLVEHSLGVRGVGSSNLPVPTNIQILIALSGSVIPCFLCLLISANSSAKYIAHFLSGMECNFFIAVP